MKSKITILIFLLISSISLAQTKVGTIDNDFIINLMPEAKIVVKRTQDYGAKLDSSYSIKVKEYQDKVADFRKKEKDMGDLMKKTIVKELAALEEDMQRYKTNGNKLMQLKQNELMRPLYKRLNTAIKEVAKANGYTQVLNTNGNQFAYLDDTYDITKLVLNKLGVKPNNTSK